MDTNDTIIQQTKKWLTNVVVGCNFCPFAAREIQKDSIRYTVTTVTEKKPALEAFAKSLMQLQDEPVTETLLLIFSTGFKDFGSYLQLVDLAEDLLQREGYEGVFQVASFHPQYLFAGSSENDPANYTNRSPYPMLHLLREESLSKAIDHFPGTENIPLRNIEFATAKGLAYMKMLRDACMNIGNS